MSKTKQTIEKTGQIIPKKTRKKYHPKKFFGWRDGVGDEPHGKKGVDFINYGYPSERRIKSVIKRKIMEELYDQEIEENL